MPFGFKDALETVLAAVRLKLSQPALITWWMSLNWLRIFWHNLR
jgi:hypothetical protein